MTTNLYESLYTDDDDLGMLAINELYGHLNFDHMSRYISLEQYQNLFSNDDALNIIHFNIRSLEHNLVHLEALLSTLSKVPDIIALTETWLNEDNMNLYSIEGYTAFHIVREPLKHGGVSLFVREHLNCEKIEQFSYLNNTIEICSIVVKIDNASYTIAGIYWPSKNKYDKIKEFRKELSPILKHPLFKKSNAIILGDFNIDLLMHGEHQHTNEYLNMLQTFNYTPLITRPTRFPQGRQLGNPALLDHIFINFSQPCAAYILHYEITDHLPVILNLHLPKSVESSYSIKFRIFNKENNDKFTRKLAYTMWEEILTNEDANTNFESFFVHFEKIYNECFPITSKTISEKRFRRPWLSSGLFVSIKNKNKLFKDFKTGAATANEYKTYKNKLSNLLKTAKRKYYVQLFSNFKSNTKKLWQAINELTNKKNRQSKIDNIIVNNKTISKASDISECFNSFFVNVAKDLDQKLPSLDTDPMQYLSPPNPQFMQIPSTNISEVTEVIKSLKNKKCGVHDFSPMILKSNSHLIALPLTQLLNQSFQQGIFPNRLKLARVIPLYKKGAKTDPNNYRPISLLNIFSKIFEKVMKKKLVKFIDSNKILSRSQFGFQKNVSTEEALTQFSKNIYRQLDNSNTVLSIFIDFSKAFDTVPHQILLRKLEHYGIKGKVLDWFGDYLSHRKQYTAYENSASTSQETVLGVPQGSVLGPILFLLFINDLPNVSKLFYTLLFADDATMSLSGRNPSLLIRLANNELHKFYLWCISNRLTVNTLKTFFVLFSSTCHQNLPPLVIKSHMNYDIIKQVSSTKFLGIIYDQAMTFRDHINYLSQRLSRTAALIYRVKFLKPDFVLKKSYHAHVTSIFCYGNIVWANTLPTHI